MCRWTLGVWTFQNDAKFYVTLWEEAPSFYQIPKKI